MIYKPRLRTGLFIWPWLYKSGRYATIGVCNNNQNNLETLRSRAGCIETVVWVIERMLLHSHAAVDAKDLACDVVCFVGGEEGDGSCNVFDGAETSHRYHLLCGFFDGVG